MGVSEQGLCGYSSSAGRNNSKGQAQLFRGLCCTRLRTYAAPAQPQSSPTSKGPRYSVARTCRPIYAPDPHTHPPAKVSGWSNTHASPNLQWPVLVKKSQGVLPGRRGNSRT